MFRRFRSLLYVTVYILGLSLLGLLNVAILDWNWDVVTWEWVTEINLYNMLYFSFFVATLSWVLDGLTKEADYREKMDSIKALRPKVEGEGLRIYVDKINFYEKSQAFIVDINSRISKLQKRYSNKVSNELRYVDEKNWSPKTIKFKRKLDNLKEMLTDEWLDKYLVYEKVKYPEMEYFELLYSTVRPKTRGSRFVRSYAKKQITSKLWLMSLTTVATIAITIITIVGFNDISNLIFELSTVLILLSLNVLSGVGSGYASHKERILDTADRLQIMLDYKNGETRNTRELPKNIVPKEEIKIEEKIEVQENNDEKFDENDPNMVKNAIEFPID